jgi:cell division protein FtsB
MPRGQTADLGSERIAPNGYHYTRCETGWRLTHHLTMEKVLGRPIAANERVSFKAGYGRDDYANPDAVQVNTKSASTNNKRIAYLEARIEEMQAEIDDLRSSE